MKTPRYKVEYNVSTGDIHEVAQFTNKAKAIAEAKWRFKTENNDAGTEWRVYDEEAGKLIYRSEKA
jgi:hypothetical protein